MRLGEVAAGLRDVRGRTDAAAVGRTGRVGRNFLARSAAVSGAFRVAATCGRGFTLGLGGGFARVLVGLGSFASGGDLRRSRG